jgi:hypothetical protein
MMTKQKKDFISAMKWNLSCKNNPKKMKRIPTITCGAFGKCKVLRSAGKLMEV